jgi:hypothetical protein
MGDLFFKRSGGLAAACSAILDVEHRDTVLTAGECGGDETVETSGGENQGQGFGHIELHIKKCTTAHVQ